MWIRWSVALGRRRIHQLWAEVSTAAKLLVRVVKRYVTKPDLRYKIVGLVKTIAVAILAAVDPHCDHQRVPHDAAAALALRGAVVDLSLIHI